METMDVKVRLCGEDGNVFFIIGRVSRALKQAGFHREAQDYLNKAASCKSYNEVIQLTADTVTVE